MRAVKWTGYLVSLLALLAAVVLLIVLLTPAGVTLARELTARFVPALSLTGISGTLLGEVCVTELDYQTEAMVISASELCVTANVWQSLDQLRISLAALSARSLTITALVSSAAVTDTRTIPELPVVVAVDQFTINELQMDAIRIDALSGRLKLVRSVLDAQASLRYQDWPVSMTAAGPWSALQLEGEVLVPEPVAVSATLDLTRQALPYVARIGVPSLDLNPLLARNLQLGALALSLTGDLSRYQFDLTTSGSDQMFGRFELDSRGEGDLQGARLSAQLAVNPQVSVIEQIGTLQIDGSVQWLPELVFAVDVIAASLSASLEQHQLTLGGRIHLSGTTDDVLVDANGMTGLVNDFPAAGDLRVRWRTDQLDIERADFVLADGRLALAGSLHEDQLSGVRVHVDQLPLALARMGAQGLVSGELTVSGSVAEPEFQAELLASQLSYESFVSQTINLLASGTTANMQVTASVVTEAYSADSDFELRRIESTTEVDLQSLVIELTADQSPAVQLTLLEPTRARWQSGSFNIQRSCLTGALVDSASAAARLCVEIQYPDGTGRVELEELRLAQLPIPAGDLLVDALVSGRVEVEAFTPLRGRAEFRIAELVANIDSYQRALGTLNGSLKVDNGLAELGLTSEPDQPLQVTGELAAQIETDTAAEAGENVGAKLADAPLQGVLAVSVDGIRIVEEFLPMALAYELSDLRGSLHLDVDVAGVLGAPELDGTLQMRDAGWRNEAIGTDFSNVTMRAQLRDNRTVDLSAAGDLESGNFAIEGQLDGLAGNAPALMAAVTLDDARVIDLPDYSGKLTGKLALEVSSQALKIAGELALPSARVQIVELPETALSASEDTVIVGARAEPAQQVRTTDVAVTLGDDVRLRALGLNARLEGALRLREFPGLPPDVRGTLTLREGRFKAYGKELQVSRGLLTFSGPMDDPTVDVIASRLVPRESGDVLVSLVLSGTARTIETEVISNPVLPEGDALALLLTGRTLSEMTNSEQASMTGTAVTLGLYGASGLTRSIAETLALEEIIVGKDETGEWEAGAALRLQHNLYLRYTYGVFSRIGGVLLRYRLTERVSVQAKSGDSHSIELRYGVD